MTTRVLMMGTEACGKTILLAVLAQKYRALGEEGYFLEAMNAEAHAFTNRNWEILANQGEWPPATPPGALRGFIWRLHRRASSVHGEPAPASEILVDLTMADFAGEVFRKAFGRGDTTSEEAAQLMAFVHQTDGIVCLVNLRDIIDEQDVERKSETEWAIKNLIDHAAKRLHIPVLLAFTQADRYEALLEGRDAREVVHVYMPQVAGAHPDVPVLFVSAVDRTILAAGDDGLMSEKPAKNFGSRGISELLAWISSVPVRSRPEPPPIPDERVQPASRAASPDRTSRSRLYALFGLLALIPFAFFGLWSPTSSAPPVPPRNPPIPVKFYTRDAISGSKVVQVHNMSDQTLDIVCMVVRPPNTTELQRKPFTIYPRTYIEYGWLEGHGFYPGDRLRVHAEGFEDTYVDL